MKSADNAAITQEYPGRPGRPGSNEPKQGGSGLNLEYAYALRGSRKSAFSAFLTDYGLAAAIAIGAHVAVAFSGGDKGKKATVAEEAPPTAMTVNVQIEPEEQVNDEEVVASDSSTQQTESFAPPQLVDVPSVVFDSAFVQPLQPTVPQVNVSNMSTVPKGRVSAEAVTGRVNKVFDLASLDQVPEMRGGIRPVYPPDLRRAGIEGTVVVAFVVDANGDVRDVEVIRSTHPGFDLPSVQAIRKLKFKPGRKGGSAVATRMEQPLDFKLNNR